MDDHLNIACRFLHPGKYFLHQRYFLNSPRGLDQSPEGTRADKFDIDVRIIQPLRDDDLLSSQMHGTILGAKIRQPNLLGIERESGGKGFNGGIVRTNGDVAIS